MLDFAWMVDHLDELAFRTGQHIALAAIAVAVGLVISFPLAVLAVRRRVTYGPILGVTAILYTIPSLALFVVLVSITGISLLTVEIPLVLYTLVIFVRNIAAGFDSVPRDVLEAANGLGYTASQRLWRVEVPLAVPLILAGWDPALVAIVTASAVTLATFLITEGIRTQTVAAVIGTAASVTLVAILAVVACLLVILTK